MDTGAAGMRPGRGHVRTQRERGHLLAWEGGLEERKSADTFISAFQPPAL